MTDKNGMPIPHKDDPHFRAKILTFRYAVYQTDDHLDWSTSDCEAMANYAFAKTKENQKLRDIVRRLAEWKQKTEWHDLFDEIAADAAKLWAEMQKGGGE